MAAAGGRVTPVGGGADVDFRRLGRSDLRVSPIAFGAFKIGRNIGVKYADHYQLPAEIDAARLLHAVLDLGINLIDTAPAYGVSETRIGQALADRRREFVLCTKVGETFIDGRSTYDFSASAIEQSVENSLRALRTDVVDVLLLHAPADDLAVLQQTDAVSTLQDLKARGATRLIGLSGKTLAAEWAALSWADVLMIEYNALDRTHAPSIAAAAAAGVGVLVKKGLAAGRLPAEEAIPAVLEVPGVASLVVGSLRIDHLRNNLALAQNSTARGN